MLCNEAFVNKDLWFVLHFLSCSLWMLFTTLVKREKFRKGGLERSGWWVVLISLRYDEYDGVLEL